MGNSNIRRFNSIMLVIFSISNLFLLIPLTINILLTGGGPFAFGILLLPFQITAHLFIIPVFMSLNVENLENRTYLWVNGIGAFLTILWSAIVLASIESYQTLFQQIFF